MLDFSLLYQANISFTTVFRSCLGLKSNFSVIFVVSSGKLPARYLTPNLVNYHQRNASGFLLRRLTYSRVEIIVQVFWLFHVSSGLTSTSIISIHSVPRRTFVLRRVSKFSVYRSVLDREELTNITRPFNDFSTVLDVSCLICSNICLSYILNVR